MSWGPTRRRSMHCTHTRDVCTVTEVRISSHRRSFRGARCTDRCRHATRGTLHTLYTVAIRSTTPMQQHADSRTGIRLVTRTCTRIRRALGTHALQRSSTNSANSDTHYHTRRTRPAAVHRRAHSLSHSRARGHRATTTVDSRCISRDAALQHSVLTVPSPRAAVFTSASLSSRIAGHRPPRSALSLLHSRSRL
jgi:hypothetical protein